MFNQNTTSDTKIAVLEERLSAYELMLRRIDEAIQLMGRTNQNISKMLAVHEERLEQCNRSDDLISGMIEDLKQENRDQHDQVNERIDKMEVEIQEISKIKWMTVGCGVLLTILVAAFASLASGWWTPSEMQVQREGHSHQETVNPN